MDNEKKDKQVQEQLKVINTAMKYLITDKTEKFSNITKKIIETINILVYSESSMKRTEYHNTKRLTDIEERLENDGEVITDNTRELNKKADRNEMNKKIEKKEIEILAIIDEFKKDRWENEEEVDEKFNSCNKDIQDLKKTVEDLKKIVKEQEKTIFNLKYPSVA